MNGYGYIEDVENIFKCTKICLQVGDCHHASFDTKNNRCYLKNAKGPEGVQYDGDFQTAPQHCQSNSCVLQVRRLTFIYPIDYFRLLGCYKESDALV